MADGEAMEIVDLSSDEEGEPPLRQPSQAGVVAAGFTSDLNQIELEPPVKTSRNSPNESSLDVNHGPEQDLSQRTEGVPVFAGPPKSAEKPVEEPTLSMEAPLEASSISENGSGSTNKAQPTNVEDDDIEFVEEVVKQPKKVVKNLKLLKLGDEKFYKDACTTFKKDPDAMRKMVVGMIMRTDPSYCDSLDEIKELKERQKYRAKEIEELKNQYATLQNDVYRLGNPLDMETQCFGDAEWDPVEKSISVNGAILREVRLTDIQVKYLQKIDPPPSKETNHSNEPEAIDLSDDEVIDTSTGVIDVRSLPTGEPTIYNVQSYDSLLVAEDPKVLSCTWSPGQIMENVELAGKPFFRIMFDKPTLPNLTVPKDCVVVTKTQPVKFPVKVRVVAGLRTSPESVVPIMFLAGFVAELPIDKNDYKYLVLFDSGDACYVPHNDIFLNHQVTFDKVIPLLKGSQETKKQATFLEKYFETYPNRLLAVPKPNEKIRVMVQNLWFSAKVKTFHHSLVQVRIKKLKVLKWFFRGSYHVKPIFDQLFPDAEVQYVTKLTERPISTSNRARRSGLGRRPVQSLVATKNAEITVDDDSDDSCASSYSGSSLRGQSRPRFARKKSAAYPQRVVLEKIQQNPNYPLRFIINEDSSSLKSRRKRVDPFRSHFCSSKCLRYKTEGDENFREYDPCEFRDVNPYCVPIVLGWTREMRTVDRAERENVICYKTPCGKSLLSFEKLSEFLVRTKSELPINLFSFEPKLDLYTEEESMGCYYMNEDLSNGLEPKSISVVNQYTADGPVPFMYNVMPTFSAKLLEEKAVALDYALFFDQQFNSCCSCTDLCQDPAKCECQQITKDQCKVKFPHSKKQWVSGYENKLSENYVETGIYECNSGCSCDKLRCFNRVASLGVQHRLQLFKTQKKGWGVRTLHDIPPGSFVCAYVARILTPEEGNDDTNPDVYFADLDLLGRMEEVKRALDHVPEDFVSSGGSSESEEDVSDWRYDTDRVSSIPRPRRKEDDTRSKPAKFTFSIQRYLGDECAYVMDAHEEGNIGRYFNHSCDPNAYVQNVFIHTHDPRFPMIALFTARLVKAFEEITWDYGYTVGAVPGRELYCYCGARKCRKRLL